jgi:HK97 family phage prohead protease
MSAFQYKNAFSCELKDVDKGSRIMKGAFTRYNVKDSDGDIGRKGMFAKTWKENFPRIKHLLNHDVTKPVGKIKSLWEDDDYAYYESQVGTHKLGDDVLDMAQSGLLTEHSYGYNILREEKAKDGNHLLEVKQWELSNLTGWGANEYTPLLEFTKSMDAVALGQRLEKRMKALESYCYNSTASDETIQLLLLEIKQLQQHILDLSTSSTHAAEEAPEPQKGIKDEEWLMLNASLETEILNLKMLQSGN